MKNTIRMNLCQTLFKRYHIFEIRLHEMYSAFYMMDVFHPAPPPDHPKDLCIGMVIQDVIGQMTSGKACDPRD
jgi:hypothetical protein